MRIMLLLLWVFCSATLLAKQQTFADLTRETQAWLFAEPSAEYKLMANGRSVRFCNPTPKKIAGFRLGCAERRNDGVSILKKGEWESQELEAVAGGNIACAGWASAHDFPLVTGCSKGQFAVIEARFEDGTAWQLKP